MRFRPDKIDREKFISGALFMKSGVGWGTPVHTTDAIYIGYRGIGEIEINGSFYSTLRVKMREIQEEMPLIPMERELEIILCAAMEMYFYEDAQVINEPLYVSNMPWDWTRYMSVRIDPKDIIKSLNNLSPLRP